jgi:hypothetical protein
VITKGENERQARSSSSRLVIIASRLQPGATGHQAAVCIEQKAHIRVVLKLQINERKALGKPSQGG